MSRGKVFLVGAGPGDSGLLTRKGYEVLQKADLVCYDSLVGDGVLSMIPEGIRTVNVGKRASRHTMPQSEMNLLLAEEAQKGSLVVRLKGGDPFLFGRGGEELELLADRGIPFEVVPGVTSSIAVPAYNGIPVTHRDFTSSLHIITGHKKAGEDLDINFRALTELEGTLVFLMGISALPDICRGLLDAGMDPDMPAAVLQQGTTAGQKRVVAHLSSLEEEVRRKGIETPAIIVVGKVCALAERFSWYERLPLFGYKVVVTRPRGRRSTLADRLRERGAEVLEIPAITTRPAEDQSILDQALEHIESYQWMAFTSPYGAEVFFDELIRRGIDIRRLAGIRIAAIGEGTKKELRARGLGVDLMPEVYDGDHLGMALAGAAKKGDWILLPRARIGNPEILAHLREFHVDDIPIYQTEFTSPAAVDERALFETGRIGCAVFTSTSTVQAFAETNKGLDFTSIRAACIGRQTREAADALGMQTYMSKKATIESLIELVTEMKEG